MPPFYSTPSRQFRFNHSRALLRGASGRMIVELGCWIAGGALIAIYFTASAGLEKLRQQGLERFAQERAVGLVDHRVESQALLGHSTMISRLDNKAAGAASLPIAVLRMTGIGLEIPVYPDINELNLNRGAGWIQGTAAPNSGGNMAVAAHRDRFFRPLKDVRIGDKLEIESLYGHGEFRVSRIIIVDPDDVSVLDNTAVPTVTLVTCYPFYFIGNAPQRYIVQAIAVEPTGRSPSVGAIPIALQSGETQ